MKKKWITYNKYLKKFLVHLFLFSRREETLWMKFFQPTKQFFCFSTPAQAPHWKSLRITFFKCYLSQYGWDKKLIGAVKNYSNRLLQKYVQKQYFFWHSSPNPAMLHLKNVKKAVGGDEHKIAEVHPNEMPV